MLGKVQEEHQATLRLHFTRFLFFLGKRIDAVFLFVFFFYYGAVWLQKTLRPYFRFFRSVHFTLLFACYLKTVSFL